MADQKAAYNQQEPTSDKRTFSQPHKYVRNEESGTSSIDHKQSESFIALSVDIMKNKGVNVYYAQKANKYFKDADCNVEMTTQELGELGLPLPTAISAARMKVMQEALDAGIDLSREDLYNSTSPTRITPSAEYVAKFVKVNTPVSILDSFTK